MSKVQIKKLVETAMVPTKGSEHSAGYDLYSVEEYKLVPGERKLFKTGISISIPFGQYGRIAPRSGLAHKHGLDVLAGVIDEDYRGEIGVILINLGKEDKEIKIGDKIAQLIFEYYNNIEFELVKELSETQRGDGGFGSTDGKIHPQPEFPKNTLPPEGGTLVELYKKVSVVPTKEKYLEEIRKRETGS